MEYTKRCLRLIRSLRLGGGWETSEGVHCAGAVLLSASREGSSCTYAVGEGRIKSLPASETKSRFKAWERVTQEPKTWEKLYHEKEGRNNLRKRTKKFHAAAL